VTDSSKNNIERHNVLGVGISVLTLESATEHILNHTIEAGFVGYVTVTGVHGVMESQRDANIKKIHNGSFLSTPDGMPMVWLGKWNGHSQMTRVYGPDLMLKTLNDGVERGVNHYFFGGGDGVASKLKSRLEEQIKGLKVVGTNTPPFRPLTSDEEETLLEEIEQNKAQVVWVGLSTPKQEKFMSQFIESYGDRLRGLDHGVVFVGVGAAFDFHASLVKQAPSWIQNIGMEWAFRVIMEPRRLWRRYWQNNFSFILKIIPQMMGITSYEIKKQTEKPKEQ